MLHPIPKISEAEVTRGNKMSICVMDPYTILTFYIS